MTNVIEINMGGKTHTFESSEEFQKIKNIKGIREGLEIVGMPRLSLREVVNAYDSLQFKGSVNLEKGESFCSIKMFNKEGETYFVTAIFKHSPNQQFAFSSIHHFNAWLADTTCASFAVNIEGR